MNEYKGIMPTKIELTLEQSQQGVSNDVLVETGSIHNLSVFIKMNSDIEDDIMDPVMQCITLPSHSSFSQQKLVSFVTEIHTTSIDFLTPRPCARNKTLLTLSWERIPRLDSGVSVDKRVFPTFVDWHTNASKDGTSVAGSYSAADVAVLNTRRTPIQKQPEELLCLVGLSRRYFLGDDVYPTFLYDDDRDMGDATAASESSGTPSTIEKSPLDFANEDPPQTITERGRIEDQGQDGLLWEIPHVDNPMLVEVAPDQGKEMAAMGPIINKRRFKGGKEDTAAIGLKTSSTFSAPASQETPADVSDPDPLSFAKPQSHPEQDVSQSFEVFTGHMDTTELRQAFANVVSAGLAKGMSEDLKYGIEHGKAGRELTIAEEYDPEADEKLKDAPIEVIMASLYLESDSREDAPQWIRDLRPISSQLKIPIYHEVRNLEDPWAIKEEMPLEDVIAGNISRTKKKRKFWVVCCTHGVGSTHHARSNGVPVSMSTVAPQGLAILLADAATQIEDEVSPRLLRSKSLPPMYNLD
ncbi:hypothetical protein Tco_0090486 [Tanacetum coccineum]